MLSIHLLHYMITLEVESQVLWFFPGAPKLLVVSQKQMKGPEGGTTESRHMINPRCVIYEKDALGRLTQKWSKHCRNGCWDRQVLKVFFFKNLLVYFFPH